MVFMKIFVNNKICNFPYSVLKLNKGEILRNTLLIITIVFLFMFFNFILNALYIWTVPGPGPAGHPCPLGLPPQAGP
jgi:hypothetical protein